MTMSITSDTGERENAMLTICTSHLEYNSHAKQSNQQLASITSIINGWMNDCLYLCHDMNYGRPPPAAAAAAAEEDDEDGEQEEAACP